MFSSLLNFEIDKALGKKIFAFYISLSEVTILDWSKVAHIIMSDENNFIVERGCIGVMVSVHQGSGDLGSILGRVTPKTPNILFTQPLRSGRIWHKVNF